MERLTKQFLSEASLSHEVQIPAAGWDQLPVKVLQFGTGVLLRGLPDYFIDKANRQGLFNGRIVVVKSTASGKTDGFQDQDGLYTLCVKGIENGKEVEELIVNSSIKEVLSAADQWEAILEYAADPELKLVISNTTEVGISYDKHDRIFNTPPQSFPGKLLAVLYKRFQTLGNREDIGLVILPTELISENGKKLKEIIFQLAEQHQLEGEFMSWLEQANYFCNTLVDRIVPGKMAFQEHQQMESRLGYQDELMIMAEPFRLWAIEAADSKVSEVLSFSSADEGLVITPDITKFKELKLRLLNGTHTFSCGLAVLAGYETVKEAMSDPLMESFIKNLALGELVPTVVARGLDEQEARSFAEKVLDRFRNQSLDHKWINITLNYTSKMEMRNAALIKSFQETFGEAPAFMSLGFAAYLLFMKGKKSIDNTYKGYLNSIGYYPINDEEASVFEGWWHTKSPQELVETALSDTRLWKIKLNFPDFQEKVLEYLNALVEEDPKEVIKGILESKAKLA